MPIHIERWHFNMRQPVAVSYKAMERLMGRRTFSGALKQLEANGFLKKTQTGGLFRTRNYFEMTEEWRRIDREEREKKIHVDGISIKGMEMHTVGLEKKLSTGMQMHTVELSGGS